MSFDRASVRALTFDVFGTVVDWRSSVIDEGRALGARLGFDHSQAGRVHPNETSVRRHDLDALRTGLKNSLEKLPIVLETASLYRVSTLIGMRNSL